MGLAHLLQTIALVCHYLTNREAFMNNSFIAKRISSSVLLANILLLDNARLYPIEHLSKQLYPTKHISFFLFFFITFDCKNPPSRMDLSQAENDAFQKMKLWILFYLFN